MSIKKHEDKYWHISKLCLKLILIWTIGLYLLINNATLMVMAYQKASTYIVLSSIVFWIFIFIGILKWTLDLE